MTGRHPFFEIPAPIVIGHRGCAGEVPENTLESFARGLADGAAILESDVHATRDGVPVLIHDDDVARVTQGSGLVAELDLAELQQLDAGFHFRRSPGQEPLFRGRGLHIPSLDRLFGPVRSGHHARRGAECSRNPRPGSSLSAEPRSSP